MRYFEWSHGKGKRRPPESFVQYVVAEKFAGSDCSTVLLEETARELIEKSNRRNIPNRIKHGRIDIAVHYESIAISFVVETKIIKEKISCNDDTDRIRSLLEFCPGLDSGVLIGYTTDKKADKVGKRLEDVSNETGASIEHRIAPYRVIGRNGEFYLGAAIYLVSRHKNL